MSAAEREPTPDELLAMAYVDGELDADSLREFEERARVSPALCREVAQLKKLDLLARQQAPPEPMDHEWTRLAQDPLQRASLGLGWSLLVVAVLSGFAFAVYSLWTSEMELIGKTSLVALLVGLTLLFLHVLRGRLRTMPYDPYTEVKR